MPLLSLEDEVRSEIAHILDPSRPVFFRFSFEEVKAGHRPGWPLAYSFILHELAIIAIVLLSIVTSRFHPIKEGENLKLNPTDHVIYLPVLGGGSEGNGTRGDSRATSSRSLRLLRRVPAKVLPILGRSPFFPSLPDPTIPSRRFFNRG